MHFVTHGQQSVTLCDELDRFIPDFDSRASKAYWGRVAEAHRDMLAIRALTSELRTQLKRTGSYSGSKLELMTEFGVKMSELATEPLCLAVWSVKKQPLKRLKRPPADAELVPPPEPKKRDRPAENDVEDDEGFNEDEYD
jgi:hypothetical protein